MRLRQVELSPFDIVIYDPKIVGKFNFIGFSTTSQSATHIKPANIELNDSNSFIDNVGDPHITGNIVNRCSAPEQFLNLVATFYDNSSLGIVSTQSFGLNVANLSSNQMTSFDIILTDNKTKSQSKFYSLDIDSTPNSMLFPLNIKYPLNPALNNSAQFVPGSGMLNPNITKNQGLGGLNDQKKAQQITTILVIIMVTIIMVMTKMTVMATVIINGVKV